MDVYDRRGQKRQHGRWQDISWCWFRRGVEAISKRTIGKSFKEIMWTGCPIIHRVDGSEGIALTFDDGPHPRTTVKVLDALQRCGVPGTFFCVGENARRYPSLLRELVDCGHDVGSHSMFHLDMHRLTPARIRSEVRDSLHLLEDLLGRRVRYFRAPWGHFRWELARPRDLGLEYLVGWDVAPAWDESDARAIEAHVVREITSGSIVVMHDYLFDQSLEQAEASAKAVAGALPGIHSASIVRGIPPQTLSDLFSKVGM